MSSLTAFIPVPRVDAEWQVVNPWIVAVTVTLATFIEYFSAESCSAAGPGQVRAQST
jgi:hypothetical protein